MTTETPPRFSLGQMVHVYDRDQRVRGKIVGIEHGKHLHKAVPQWLYYIHHHGRSSNESWLGPFAESQLASWNAAPR